MSTIRDSLQTLRGKFRAKHNAHETVVKEAEQAEGDYATAQINAQAMYRKLGKAEVAHFRNGEAAPDSLREQVGATQLALITLKARADGFKAEGEKLGREIIAEKDLVARAKNAWVIAEREENSKAFEVLATEFLDRFKPIIAKARGIDNKHVLLSIRNAMFIVNGRNIFTHLARCENDADMIRIAREWATQIDELKKETVA